MNLCGNISRQVERWLSSASQLSIENAVESEFMSALSTDLARELLEGFNISGADVGLPEEPSPQAAASCQLHRLVAEQASVGAALSQDEIEKLLAQSMPSAGSVGRDTAAGSRTVATGSGTCSCS